MAPKSTSFFTSCVSGVSPLKTLPDVLQPIEEAIHQFFTDLKNHRPISKDKLIDCKTILSDLISNELLPSENSSTTNLAEQAKNLQGQLTAIEYFSQHPIPEVMDRYLALVSLNQRSVNVVKSDVQSKKSGEPLMDTVACRDFLHEAQQRIQEIHQLLKPLEVQPPLSLVMPPFEEPSDVYFYVAPFQARAERVVWLNSLKDELGVMSRKLSQYEGVFDPGLRRLHDQCQQGVVALLKRMVLLRSDFTRRPKSSREALSGGAALKDTSISGAGRQGIFSKNPGNLTLS